jgi:predicted DNA-binding transcriptional regulator AlpA
MAEMQEHARTDTDYADRLINEQEAAAFLGYSVRALQNWRLRGGGPEYVRVSRRSVRYRRRDLTRWAGARLEAHTSASSIASSPQAISEASEEGRAAAAAPTSDAGASAEDQRPRGRTFRTLLPHDQD